MNCRSQPTKQEIQKFRENNKQVHKIAMENASLDGTEHSRNRNLSVPGRGSKEVSKHHFSLIFRKNASCYLQFLHSYTETKIKRERLRHLAYHFSCPFIDLRGIVTIHTTPRRKCPIFLFKKRWKLKSDCSWGESKEICTDFLFHFILKMRTQISKIVHYGKKIKFNHFTKFMVKMTFLLPHKSHVIKKYLSWNLNC